MYSNQSTASLSRQEQIRGHLPSWQRSSLTDHLRKGGKIRQLHRNETILPPKNDHRLNQLEGSSSSQEKVSTLERRLEFLKSQHTDTLTHLHEELDSLKTENKELNFKLVMCRCGMSSRSTISRGQSRQLQRTSTPKLKPREDQGSHNVVILEEQLQTVQDSIQKEKKRNSRLMRVVEKMMQRSLDNSAAVSQNMTLLMNNNNSINGDYSQLSTEEYKTIIEHLLQLHKQQDKQIVELQQDLHDVLSSDEFPNASTVKERCNNELRSQKIVLPRIAIKDDRHTITHEQPSGGTLHLPALRSRIPQTQRYKRTVQLQRTRFGTFPR